MAVVGRGSKGVLHHAVRATDGSGCSTARAATQIGQVAAGVRRSSSGSRSGGWRTAVTGGSSSSLQVIQVHRVADRLVGRKCRADTRKVGPTLHLTSGVEAGHVVEVGVGRCIRERTCVRRRSWSWCVTRSRRRLLASKGVKTTVPSQVVQIGRHGDGKSLDRDDTSGYYGSDGELHGGK